MRFFGADNRRFEWTMAIAVLIIVIYVLSFCIIRYQATSDECGLRRVDFPGVVARLVYRPLISIDKMADNRVVYNGEVDEVRFAQKYFCGE